MSWANRRWSSSSMPSATMLIPNAWPKSHSMRASDSARGSSTVEFRKDRSSLIRFSGRVRRLDSEECPDPKSSRAMAMPRAWKSARRAAIRKSARAAVSVISMTRRRGSAPVSSSASSNHSMMPSAAIWLGDMLMNKRKSPGRSFKKCRDRRINRLPKSLSRPAVSAVAMNSSGPIGPCGEFHRASASYPMTLSPSSAKMG